jgi:hypothetical protein
MTRRANDNYPTESAMLAPLLELDRGHLITGTVFEPCAGSGQLAGPLRQAGLEVLTNDISEEYDTLHHFDATVAKNWSKVSYCDWVVTNPPWTSGILEPIMASALSWAKIGVALLLRLTANEPVIRRSERGNILMTYADNLRYIQTFSAPRPRYDPTKKGTDSVTSAWFVWHKGWNWKYEGIESPFQYVVDWLPKPEPLPETKTTNEVMKDLVDWPEFLIPKRGL